MRNENGFGVVFDRTGYVEPEIKPIEFIELKQELDRTKRAVQKAEAELWKYWANRRLNEQN